MKQIRLRALSPPSGLLLRRGRSYARPELKLSNFSNDEDELILKLHALLGNRWSLIAGRLPGRSDKEVMVHWETYLKRKLIKMGIDPTNHRLHHHRPYLSSLHKKHATNNISHQSSSSSVSESCDMTSVSGTDCCSKGSTSLGQSRLPDLNIGLTPNEMITSLPAPCHQDSSESSNYGSTGQETLLLFQ